MALRNAFENIALESTLATIRDTILRRTDPLAAGSNVIGKVQFDAASSYYVSPSTTQHALGGRFWLSSSLRMTLTVAGNVRATIANPAGSGKNVLLMRMVSFSTQGPAWATIWLNPTTGLPTTAPRPNTNAIPGTPYVSVAQLKVDTDTTVPLGGGTDTGLIFGIPAAERVTIDLPPLVIVPGVTMGLNIPYAGASESVFSAYWIEA